MKAQLLVIALAFTHSLRAQETYSVPSDRAVPVQMIVTAEPLRGGEDAISSARDIKVLQHQTPLRVTELLPLQGDNAGLELYVAIDERVNPEQTILFDQLRQFVLAQPAATAVGIAYLHNAEARIAQTPTTDHSRAAKALAPPSGDESAAASPYMSLTALINAWPKGAVLRREAIVVTDGIDRFENVGEYNMYVDHTIADAQRQEIIVYCLYAPALGHAGHSLALIHWGQTYLAQLAEETGGEAYFVGLEPPKSFEPYLADIAQHLARQFRITFLATPDTREAFQGIRFESGIENVELVGAYKFYLAHEPLR